MFKILMRHEINGMPTHSVLKNNGAFRRESDPTPVKLYKTLAGASKTLQKKIDAMSPELLTTREFFVIEAN